MTQEKVSCDRLKYTINLLHQDGCWGKDQGIDYQEVKKMSPEEFESLCRQRTHRQTLTRENWDEQLFAIWKNNHHDPYYNGLKPPHILRNGEEKYWNSRGKPDFLTELTLKTAEG